jgi:DNA-binding NarL/FixJ family response regulator
MAGRCDLIDDLMRIVAQCGERAGLASDDARRLSVTVCVELQRRYGAESHYIRAEDRSERDRLIMSQLAAGSSAAEVARSIGIHERTVRRVRDRRLVSGFGPPGWEL